MAAYAVLQVVVFVLFLLAAIVALTHWAVRRGFLAPFGWWPAVVRRVSDPVVVPIERRVHRAGGNPQDAPLWLAGAVLVLGLVALWLVRTLATAVHEAAWLADAGPRGWARALLGAAFLVLKVALIVRVVASWFGRGEYTRWLRPVYLLTDWLVRPLRRVLPAVGMFDLSPLVAYLLIIIVEGLVT